VEFFPIAPFRFTENGKPIPFDSKCAEGEELARILKKNRGLYSFYDSQAGIIYFGKTEKTNLYIEIINAYRRNLSHYSIYRVRHPWGFI
jgi:hypothetical protein